MFARGRNKSVPPTGFEKKSEIKDLGGGVSFIDGLPSAEEREKFIEILQGVDDADFLVYCLGVRPPNEYGTIEVIRVGDRPVSECDAEIVKALPGNRALSIRDQYMSVEFQEGADLRRVVFSLGATTYPDLAECDGICAKASRPEKRLGLGRRLRDLQDGLRNP